MVATSRALEDMGEHRSPKNTPDRMAPPSKGAGRPAARPSIMQIKPMVLAVPKEVPVRKDIRLQSRKAQRAKAPGWIHPTAWYRMNGMVPQIRQPAVIRPIKTNTHRMVALFSTPRLSVPPMAAGEKPSQAA